MDVLRSKPQGEVEPSRGAESVSPGPIGVPDRKSAGNSSSLTSDPKVQSPVTARRSARSPKQDRPPADDRGIWRISRRNLFSIAGWASVFVFLGTSIVATLRMMFPRVLYEPPSTFKAGFPNDYVVGEVSERYKDAQRVWIIRNPDGFYALLAICTHLGCTPRWLSSDNKFKCPCHGSGFHRSGMNFEGPAPRPLERLKITLGDDGQILVDKSVRYRFERGDWVKPGAYLYYS